MENEPVDWIHEVMSVEEIYEMIERSTRVHMEKNDKGGVRVVLTAPNRAAREMLGNWRKALKGDEAAARSVSMFVDSIMREIERHLEGESDEFF